MDMTKLLPPEGVNTCSVDGVEYAAGDDGLIEVPAGFVQHLAQFGFTNPPAEAPAAGKRGKKGAEQPVVEPAAEQPAEAPAADAQA